jgi:hypothetical protein
MAGRYSCSGFGKGCAFCSFENAHAKVVLSTDCHSGRPARRVQSDAPASSRRRASACINDQCVRHEEDFPVYSPAKLDFLELLPPGCEFRVHSLNRLQADTRKAFACPGGESVQIKGAKPLARACKWTRCLVAGRVGMVLNLIHLDCGGIKPSVPFGLHFEAQCAYAVLDLACHKSIR